MTADPQPASPPAPLSPPQKRSLPAWLLLLLLTALLYLPGTGDIPLMDRDEPRFAHATMEMMQRDTWLIPYFNGEYRFDKPPLTYWWMRLHYLLLGFNELAARLHSVVAVWLVAIVVFRTGKRLFSPTAGWWAAVGWLTCLQALIHGRLCVADMPMVLCVTLTMAALLELLTGRAVSDRRFPAAWWQLWLSIGAGFLAKGPIALLVPVLAVLLWRFAFWRKPAPWRRLGMGWGLLMALAIVAAWGIPALLQTHGLFWKVGMGEHVVKRGTQAFNGRVVLPFYYFATAFLSLLPWIAFLPLVWKHLRASWNAQTTLLLGWFTAPYLIFLAYATQLPHYVMPGFPGFFLLLGATLVAAPARRGISWGRFGWIYVALMTLVGLAALGVAWVGPWVTVDSLRWAITAGASLLLALVILGIAVERGSRVAMGLAVLLAAACLVPFGKALRAEHPVIQLAPELAQVSGDKDLLAWGFTEPSLVFYSDRQWTMLSKMERVKERLAKGRAGAVVMLRREWTLSDRIKQWRTGSPITTSKDNQQEVEAVCATLPGARVVDVEGYNLARSSWVELRLVIPVKMQE
jgi:4-amino-4-deoxy-L-arabinose transferase-like glycosyltransferase